MARRKPYKPEYTYIIEAVGVNKVKIGKSRDLYYRLASLRTMSPVPIRLLRKIQGAKHEKELHMRLMQFRSHGEWFDLNEESAKILNAYLRTDKFFEYINTNPVLVTRP